MLKAWFEFGEVVKHRSCLVQPELWHNLPYAPNVVAHVLCITLISPARSKKRRPFKENKTVLALFVTMAPAMSRLPAHKRASKLPLHAMVSKQGSDVVKQEGSKASLAHFEADEEVHCQKFIEP